jgi:hypothetical protein
MPQVLRVNVPGYRYDFRAAIAKAGFRTQSEFAEAAGIDQAEISRILHGLRPTKTGLHKIAETLALTINEVKQLL